MSVHALCSLTMYFSLENLTTQKSGLLDTYRGDLFTLTIATGLLSVGESGNDCGRKWEQSW